MRKIASGTTTEYIYSVDGNGGSTPITASFGYSAQRLQLTSLSYVKNSVTQFGLTYGYTQNGGNNGEITSITDTVDNGRSVAYTYDSLHRVSTALTTGSVAYPQWGLSWTYDRYGNRSAQTVTAGSGPSNAVTISTATNRITNMGGSTFYYDANGNLTQDDLYKYKLDAENRLVELRNLSNSLLASYAGVYPERIRPERTSRRDGNSIRVIKVAGSTRTWYLYAGTQLIGEFTDTATNTYSAGTLPGQAGSDSTATMLFQHGDHLTTRLTSDNFSNTGNQQAHYPYGEQWYATGTADPSVKRKFTSYYKEDEAATGKLNYAVYREQSSRIGRFHMADPVRGNVRNPQRLNRYAYVRNDPVGRFDPFGLEDRPTIITPPVEVFSGPLDDYPTTSFTSGGFLGGLPIAGGGTGGGDMIALEFHPAHSQIPSDSDSPRTAAPPNPKPAAPQGIPETPLWLPCANRAGSELRSCLSWTGIACVIAGAAIAVGCAAVAPELWVPCVRALGLGVARGCLGVILGCAGYATRVFAACEAQRTRPLS